MPRAASPFENRLIQKPNAIDAAKKYPMIASQELKNAGVWNITVVRFGTAW
jgi:hypothetical protein